MRMERGKRQRMATRMRIRPSTIRRMRGISEKELESRSGEYTYRREGSGARAGQKETSILSLFLVRSPAVAVAVADLFPM
jgi:hypothetical protein